jgi:hypothetical protein
LWSGAGNEYWLERSIPDAECSERLDLVFWVLPDRQELADIETGVRELWDVRLGTIHFFKHVNATCGDDRFWLRDRARSQ